MTDATEAAPDVLGVAALTREIEEARDLRSRNKKEYEREDQRLVDRIEELIERRRVAEVGVTPEDQRAAEAIIYVRGSTLESAEGAFEAAVKALANGGEGLRRDAIGAKRYDGYHQRCDCEYGWGPGHGSIVFQVGLQQNRRESLPLSEKERDVCVRYLLARRRVDEEKAAEARRRYW